MVLKYHENSKLYYGDYQDIMFSSILCFDLSDILVDHIMWFSWNFPNFKQTTSLYSQISVSVECL